MSAQALRASKGEETRAQILDAAVQQASEAGFESLTIGTLAERTGLSKSGLFAHFGSRTELQIATLDESARRFTEAVFLPALKVPRRAEAAARDVRELGRVAGAREVARQLPDAGRLRRIRRPAWPDARGGGRAPALPRQRTRQGGADWPSTAASFAPTPTRASSSSRCSASCSPTTTRSACSATRGRRPARAPASSAWSTITCATREARIPTRGRAPLVPVCRRSHARRPAAHE